MLLPLAASRPSALGRILSLGTVLALAGCGPRPAWEVQQLQASGLSPQPPAALARCEARLALAPEQSHPADATNRGLRHPRDVYGRRVPDQPALIVLHESVLSAADTLKLFATPHPKDDDQVSYHLLIDRRGQRLRIVPDQGRAFGSGISAFGDFTVRIRPTSLGSLNNVALHLSLESPPDGRGDGDGHSGYTPEQYTAAAAQVLLWQARWGIPFSRLTTHAAVDRSRSRTDPRSFHWQRFMAAYRQAAQRCALTAYDNGRASP